MRILSSMRRIAIVLRFDHRDHEPFAVEYETRSLSRRLRALINKTTIQVRRGGLLICALVLTNLSMIESANAYLVRVDARATAVRGNAAEINAFGELDGARSAQVQAGSGGASAFAQADLGARTVRTFNTSTTEGFSDAIAEIGDIYFITGVPDDISSVDIGMSVSFEGTVIGAAEGERTAGRVLGRVGQFTVDTSFTSGGTFASGGIQTFQRLGGGGFNRIDIVMLLDSIGLFGAGTVDFSGTGVVDFDLSFLPAGADLVSESGFSVRAGQVVVPVPEPSTLGLLGVGLLGLGFIRRRRAA